MAKYGFCSSEPQNFARSTCVQLLYEQCLDLTSTASIFTNYLLAQFNQTEIQIKYKLSVDKKNQLDVTFCILYFSSNSCSTCFGQPCAHHQELTTA